MFMSEQIAQQSSRTDSILSLGSLRNHARSGPYLAYICNPWIALTRDQTIAMSASSEKKREREREQGDCRRRLRLTTVYSFKERRSGRFTKICGVWSWHRSKGDPWDDRIPHRRKLELQSHKNAWTGPIATRFTVMVTPIEFIVTPASYITLRNGI